MNKSQHATDKDLRAFGVIFSAGVAGLFGLFLPLMRRQTLPFWPWFISLPVAVAAVMHPPLLKILYRIWMKIGEVLGRINARILMGILFVLIITPVALVIRLLKRDPLRRTLDNDAATYRTESGSQNGKNMEVPF